MTLRALRRVKKASGCGLGPGQTHLVARRTAAVDHADVALEVRRRDERRGNQAVWNRFLQRLGTLISVWTDASHEHRGVGETLERMNFLRTQMQEIPGLKVEFVAVMLEADMAFDAVDGDLAGHPMRRDFLSGGDDEPDHLQSGGFQQHRGCGGTHAGPERQVENPVGSRTGFDARSVAHGMKHLWESLAVNRRVARKRSRRTALVHFGVDHAIHIVNA